MFPESHSCRLLKCINNTEPFNFLKICSPLSQKISLPHFSDSEKCAVRTTERALVQLSLGKKGTTCLASQGPEGTCWEKVTSSAIQRQTLNTSRLPLGHKQISTLLSDSIINMSRYHLTIKTRDHSTAEYIGSNSVIFLRCEKKKSV